MNVRPKLSKVLLLLISAGAGISYLCFIAFGGAEVSSLDELLVREGIPGGVLAVNDGEGVGRVRILGRAARPGLELSAVTRFPLASLSKPITASAVRHLIASGKLGLEDPVFGLLSDLPHAEDARYKQITVGQLLQHTSGLNQVDGDPMFVSGRLVGCGRALAATLGKRLEADPGHEMKYSNSGYCLLEKVIERVSGLGYENAVRSILGVNDVFTLGIPETAGYEAAGLKREQWLAAGAAGGWFSNAPAVAALFSDDSRDRTIAIGGASRLGGWFYGLGWRVWPRHSGYRLTHFGSLPGMFSVALAFPDGRSVVLLLNGNPTNDEAFAENVYGILEAELDRR